MKNALFKLIFPVLAITLFVSLGISALAAGTGADPLISFSYMQNKVKNELIQYITGKANEAIAPGSRNNAVSSFGQSAYDGLTLESLADSVSDQLVGNAGLPSEIPAVNHQREVSLTSDWRMIASAGSTVYVKSGSVTADPGDGGSIISVKDKAEITAKTVLSTGGYVVVSEKGSVTFTPGSDGATLFVTGVMTYGKPISGSVSISGSAVYGQKLSAVLTSLLPTEATSDNLAYQWMRNGEVVATSADYTLTEQDIGSSITLTVSGSGVYIGSLTSAPLVPGKAWQDAPAAPSLSGKTYNEVTLVAVSGCEYRCGDGAWQTSPTFRNLSPNTTYTFYIRKAETAVYLASPQSAALSVTTYPAEISSQKYHLNASAGLISQINTGVSVSEFLSNLNYPALVKVYNGGAEVTGSAHVGTGMTAKLTVDGNVLQSLTIVVTGDVNGDGKITLTDFVQLKAHLLGKTVFSGGCAHAADVNGDGKITLTDFVKVKACLLGKETITGIGY